MGDLTVIVLAAGHGRRMRSSTPKVLHEIAGRSLVAHVLHAVAGLEPATTVVVVGHGRAQVEPQIAAAAPGALVAVQEEQLGTGHAAGVGLAAARAAGAAGGDVLVLTADTPLLRPETLRRFVDSHRAGRRTVSVLTAEVPDAHGYGRIIRDEDGDVWSIVEERDADEVQKAVREINSGILAFDADWLAAALPRLGDANAAGELYLTDTVALARADGRRAGGFPVEDATEVEGANDLVQLSRLAATMRRRIVEQHLLNGVQIVDPDATWIDAGVTIGADTAILPGCYLRGDTRIGSHCEIGPFAHLRSGTVVEDHGKVGGFVETKQAHLGPGAKVPHLSYIGDAEIGAGANIGAGTITANYDGVAKHRTVIGRNVRSGSNVTFVAPVTVGDGAATGAGAVIREDVPPGGLGVSAGPQRVIASWAQKRRAGTPQAEAADAATAAGVFIVADDVKDSAP